MATIIKNGKRWHAQVRKFGVSKSATFLTQADAKMGRNARKTARIRKV